MKKLIIYLSLLVVLVVAFLFRTNNAYKEVFKDQGEVYLIGIDPYFYLRHVETTFNNFPHLQKWDHAAHFAQGSLADAAGLHVIFMAGLCKVLLPEGANDIQIATVIAWVSPVLSIVAFLLVFLIVKQLRDSTAGLVAASLLLLVPGKSLPRGLLGFPDHHIFELVLSLLLLYCINYIVRLSDNRLSIVKLVLSGIPLAIFFTIWSGAPLYLVLVLGVLAVVACTIDYNFEECRLLSLRSFISLLSSTLLYGIILYWFPDLITLANIDYQQDVLLVLLALSLGVPIMLYVFSYKSQHSFIGSKALLMILVCGIASLLLLYTPYGHTFSSYLNFSFGGIIENEIVTNQSFISYTGVVGIVSYVVGVVYLFTALFNHSRTNIIPLAVLSLFFTYFWYQTYDLGYLVNPFMAMIVGIGLYDLCQHYIHEEYLGQVSLFGGVVLIGLLPNLLLSISPSNYSQQDIRKSIKYSQSYKEAMTWLKNNSPEPQPKVSVIQAKDTTVKTTDDYGIMTSWDLGNLVAQKAQRKPVWSRWPSTVTAGWFAITDEQTAIDNLCPDCTEHQDIRYVIIDVAMASSYFVAKYQLIGKNINECIIQEDITINNQEYRVPKLGSCYTNSMAYQLYVNQAKNLQYFEKIYESEEMSLIATKISNNQLLLSSWSEDELNPETINQISDGMSFNLGSDLYTNCALRPTIMIFKVLTNPKTGDNQ